MKEATGVKCEALTKKKEPCPFGDASPASDGRWLCHIHHPDRLYRQQVKAKRDTRPALEANPYRALKRQEKRRRKREKREAIRAACAHCGGTYSRSKHRDICVKHGLAFQVASPES